MFERFRAFCGGHPLTIGSGYRTARWNRRQGGARKSQHPQGRAIDCHRPAGLKLVPFHFLAREFARIEPLVGGLGLYRWGVHLDIRIRSGRLAFWNQVPTGTALHDRAAGSSGLDARGGIEPAKSPWLAGRSPITVA